MKSVDSAIFKLGKGIEGDRHYTPRNERADYQVLLIESETLESLGLAHGVVKENVTTSGINLSTLTIGRKLSIGNEVRLRISKSCAPCSRMDEIRPGLQHILEGKRGMLATVISSGQVRCGDEIRLL